jgi:GT2 family glycosyltransferase
MLRFIHAGQPADGERPLVSYRIQCYRQEEFVREAIQSVLAQTYHPLEILITDDASTDRTFEIAEELVHSYRGPHRVILFRSEQNRDILDHCNEALPFLHGQFFLWMGGDDVAEPDQTAQLVAAWLEGGVSGVWSNVRFIDEQGADLGPGLSADRPPYTLNLSDYAEGRFLDFVYSGACGYSREVIDRFGPVPSHLGSRGLEHYFGFRAALLGPKRYLPQALISRRRHPNQATAGLNRADRGRDPMLAHERQVRVRLQVLIGCLDTIADPAHEKIANGLAAQIVNETRRLLEFETFRARQHTSIEHSGWHYPPNGLSFVRPIPEYQCNIVAMECRFFAVPYSLGPVEACQIRNHTHPSILSAWTEQELLAALSNLHA